MRHSVTEERCTDLPAGLPAIWTESASGVTLYLRADLPAGLADHFRRLCRTYTGPRQLGWQASKAG